MPNANLINPTLIRAIFIYDPDTGELTPRPTATLVATALPVARRSDARQWEIGKYRYSLHRLVWAYHNPDNANPRFILFKDGFHADTRIENLEAKNVHPRWEGHTKQVNIRLGADGSITVVAQKPRSPQAGTRSPQAGRNDQDKQRAGVGEDALRIPEPPNPRC